MTGIIIKNQIMSFTNDGKTDFRFKDGTIVGFMDSVEETEYDVVPDVAKPFLNPDAIEKLKAIKRTGKIVLTILSFSALEPKFNARNAATIKKMAEKITGKNIFSVDSLAIIGESTEPGSNLDNTSKILANNLARTSVMI